MQTRPLPKPYLLLRVCSALLVALVACDPGSFDSLKGRADGGRAGGPGGRDAAGGELDASRDGARPGASDADIPSTDGGRLDARSPSPSEDDGGALEPDGATQQDAAPPGCPTASDPATVRVSARELGGPSIPTVERPGLVVSARVGTRTLWVFGSPLIAVWSKGDEPPTAPPELEVPLPFVPLLPEGTFPEGMNPILGSIVAVSDTEALIFFASGVLFNSSEIGLARIRVDELQAELIHPVGQLFPYHRGAGGAEPKWIPLFSAGAFLHPESDGSYVYVYACQSDPSAPSEQAGGEHESPCRIARVIRELAHDGASYRYWNGRGWVADHAAASVVVAGAPQSFSVSYNRYLRKFLAVNNHGSADRIVVRWADRPEGPWNTIGEAATKPATAQFPPFIFGVFQHPSVASPCEEVIHASYLLPQLVNGPQGEPVTVVSLQFMRLELE